MADVRHRPRALAAKWKGLYQKIHHIRMLSHGVALPKWSDSLLDVLESWAIPTADKQTLARSVGCKARPAAAHPQGLVLRRVERSRFQ